MVGVVEHEEPRFRAVGRCSFDAVDILVHLEHASELDEGLLDVSSVLASTQNMSQYLIHDAHQ